MFKEVRQVQLILLLGILPGILLVLTLWIYSWAVEGMKASLHKQRSVSLRSLDVESASSTQHNFSWAIVNDENERLVKASPDWPKEFGPDRIIGFRNSLGTSTENGVEIENDASGPAILWIVKVASETRAALQSRRNFYARWESLRMLLWTAGLILVGGAFIVFVSMARKMSDVFNEMETKNLELERANRELEELGLLKSNFLALVSHELRTPLARLSGNIKQILLSNANFPDEVRKKLDEMAIEIRELSRMMGNVLDLTRLQSEDLSARMILGQIGDLLRGAVERNKMSAAGKGITFELETPETPPVNHDPYLLERILDNLLVNAIKYSKENSKIEIKIIEEGAFIQIHIKNSGHPIPESEKEKIFEKFHRLSKDSEIPGTGLGLYLVRQFIFMMGGRAWVEPLADGNRFIVTLPMG